ncbi:MAG: hypothetical protein FVQ81_07295 [Candidatus Glassbacteria bacterium]|nr:hypothetical protein [Candidatus Glassbacteria bacterium]
MSDMTKEELHEYDGKDEQKSYIAYEGKVYDVTDSKLWRNGTHVKTHHAGHDLTRAMAAAPHGPEVMERFQALAELVEEKESLGGESAIKTSPGWVELILTGHPHPIAVHFPIALCIAAALLAFLGLFIDEPTLEKAAHYNMLIAVLSTPVAISTGVLSWYYNYSGIWTHIYRMKTYLSILLVVEFIVALVVHCFFMGADGELWFWVYTVTVLAMAPTVMALGFYGGKITFPS